jgi:RNA polymerase sigma-70 factor (family 1)
MAEKPLYEDRVLFQQIATGSEMAFQLFFQRHRAKLYHYLLKLTKSKETSEEILQDSFIKIWTSRGSLLQVESPEHYLFVIAKNKVVDFLRRIALDRNMRQHIWSALSEARNDVEENSDARECEALIHEAVGNLTPQKQIVFRLSRLQGLTHQEIALQLNISKNTVKNHLVDSIKFIKNYLVQHVGAILFLAFLIAMLHF